MGQELFKPVAYELCQLVGDIGLIVSPCPSHRGSSARKMTAVRSLPESISPGLPVGCPMLRKASVLRSLYSVTKMQAAVTA